jgi:hypothetical protein
MNNASATANALAVYRKVASALEPGSYSWTLSGSTHAVAGIQSFSGVDTASPIDVENGRTTPWALTHPTPSVSTTVANTVLVTAHTFSSAASWTSAAGMTEAFDIAAPAPPTSVGQAIVGSWMRQSAAGATGIKTATASNDADVGNTHVLALRPVANALSIGSPAGAVANDVMIASIGVAPSSATLTPPAGWTLVRRIDNASVTANSLAVYRKVAGVTEPVSYAWAVSGASFAVGGIQAFFNVDTVNPVDVENGQTTVSGLGHSTPSVATSMANTVVVTSHTFASSATWTPPAGMSESFDQSSGVASAIGQSIESSYVLQAAAGATGVKTATASGNADVGSTHILALRPATPAPSPTPFTGTPIPVPGTFEAENFDLGGEGVAYHDNTVGNGGGQFRPSEDVDIVLSADTPAVGYVVNNFESGEWLNYTINVAQTANYRIEIRASSTFSNSAFHIEIDGANATGSVGVPNTASFLVFQNVSKGGINLSQGPHSLRLVADQQFFDVNWIRITQETDGRAIVGEWKLLAPLPAPATATHLLPTGKVMYYGSGGTGADPHLWDPVTETTSVITLPGYNLFCSGAAFLADGRLLIAGGHIANNVGVPYASTYDAVNNVWAPRPAMNAGRWYPTTTTLANGDVLVVSGSIDSSSNTNRLPEVYQDTSGTWRDLTGAQLDVDLYPWMHLAPNGKVFNSGPRPNTRYLDTAGTGTWTSLADHSSALNRSYGSSVMYADGKVLVVGGGDPPTNTAEVIDLNAATPTWQPTGSMAYPRRQHNATVLPDGKVLVTGGTSAAGFNNYTGSVFPAEMWDPATGRWTTLSSAQVMRQYHSEALLLPDGRVLSTGDDQTTQVEVYSPPYLFKGARPTITSAPAAVSYGQSFSVSTPDAASIANVTWIRLPSVTHSFNQNQVITRLSYSQAPGGLSVVAPTNANLAPPGHYMLFVLDGTGVPSVAKIVRIGPDTGPPPPPAPLQITQVAAGNIGATSAVISWLTNNAADSGVEYGTPLPPPYPSSVLNPAIVTNHAMTLSGLTPSTTYHYRVTSVDLATQSASSEDATFITTAASSNLLTNPGFENGGSGWALNARASIDSALANAHSGNASLRLVASAPWQGSTQSVTVTPGQPYTVSGWGRSTSTGTFLTLIGYTASGAESGPHLDLIFVGSGSWTQQSRSYIPPAGTVRVTINLFSKVAGTYWFDDIALTSP